MTGKIKILLVEDNEDERMFIKEGFYQSGLYEIVAEAADGNELLELLGRSPSSLPDIILSDLNMPGRNGYEVILDIKTNSSFSHIPVAILSTAPLHPYADRCKKLGACAYFTKPDTFLEYRQFSEKIYGHIRECVANGGINYIGVSLEQLFSKAIENLFFTGSLTIAFLYPKSR